MPGATQALVRALARAAGTEPQVLAASGRDWGSATFTGMRHRLTIRLPEGAAGRLARALAADALVPRGHLIVEAGVTAAAGDPTLLTIAAITVEAA